MDIFFDALKKERGIAKGWRCFILSVKHHIAAMFCVEEHVPQKVKVKIRNNCIYRS